jgi:hypothetical protein
MNLYIHFIETAIATFFSLLILYAVDRTPWRGDQPVARPLPAQRGAQTQNKRAHTSMPKMGFEPTIPVFELQKTVHALDGAAAVIGNRTITDIISVGTFSNSLRKNMSSHLSNHLH